MFRIPGFVSADKVLKAHLLTDQKHKPENFNDSTFSLVAGPC
jgi:hypothetical protein